eukprot:1161700-Pelagomonas_calceolata.AAC.1
MARDAQSPGAMGASDTWASEAMALQVCMAPLSALAFTSHSNCPSGLARHKGSNRRGKKDASKPMRASLENRLLDIWRLSCLQNRNGIPGPFACMLFSRKHIRSVSLVCCELHSCLSSCCASRFGIMKPALPTLSHPRKTNHAQCSFPLTQLQMAAFLSHYLVPFAAVPMCRRQKTQASTSSSGRGAAGQRAFPSSKQRLLSWRHQQPAIRVIAQVLAWKGSHGVLQPSILADRALMIHEYIHMQHQFKL